jgi:hypothetical protein
MSIESSYHSLRKYIATTAQDVINEGEYDQAEVNEWKGEVGQKSFEFLSMYRGNIQLGKYQGMLQKVLKKETERLTSKFKPREIDTPAYQELESLVQTE